MYESRKAIDTILLNNHKIYVYHNREAYQAKVSEYHKSEPVCHYLDECLESLMKRVAEFLKGKYKETEARDYFFKYYQGD